MRCPRCNAHNADGATFCTLCHTSFTLPPTGDAPSEEASPDDAESVAPTPDAAAGEVRTSSRGTFRRTAEGFEWRCARCHEWNLLESTACSVCKLPFRETMSPASSPEKVEITTAMALGLSAVAPGLGHIAARRNATGIMRLVLFGLFFGGGLLLQAQARRTVGAPLLAVPLLLGAIAVWTATMVDASRLAQQNDASVLSTRTYLWMLVVVLVLTLTAALPAIFRAGRPSEDLPPVGDQTPEATFPDVTPSGPTPGDTPAPPEPVTGSPSATATDQAG